MITPSAISNRCVENDKRNVAYKCNTWDFESGQAGNMRTLKDIHSEENSFKCNVCEFTAVRKGTLRIHMKVHFEEKSFKCNLCEFASVRKGILKHI